MRHYSIGLPFERTAIDTTGLFPVFDYRNRYVRVTRFSKRVKAIRERNNKNRQPQFWGGQEFRYLRNTITENNETSKEIKARIAVGNRSHYALKNILQSRNVLKDVKKMSKTPQ